MARFVELRRRVEGPGDEVLTFYVNPETVVGIYPQRGVENETTLSYASGDVQTHVLGEPDHIRARLTLDRER